MAPLCQARKNDTQDLQAGAISRAQDRSKHETSTHIKGTQYSPSAASLGLLVIIVEFGIYVPHDCDITSGAKHEYSTEPDFVVSVWN